MLKKIGLYLTAFIATAIYMLAGNDSFMRYYTGKLSESKQTWFQWDRHRYGDLYGLSYLRSYRVPPPFFGGELIRQPDSSKLFDLYIIGDSYLSQFNPGMDDSALYRTELKYTYRPGDEGELTKHIVFENNGRKKILLLERTERYIRADYSRRLANLRYLNYYIVEKSTALPSTPKAQNLMQKPALISSPNNIFTDIMQGFHFKVSMPIINQNLETLLFSYGMFTGVKETKAAFNFNLFNRVSSKVYLAPDHYNLYAYETIDPYSEYSSFRPIEEAELDTVVNNMNFIAEHYKKMGFNEVLFSIVPSAVVIEDPQIGKYNDLINKIQRRPDLSFTMIDVYSRYLSEPIRKKLYSIGDTHWTSRGFRIWIDALNEWLKSQSFYYSKNIQ